PPTAGNRAVEIEPDGSRLFAPPPPAGGCASGECLPEQPAAAPAPLAPSFFARAPQVPPPPNATNPGRPPAAPTNAPPPQAPAPSGPPPSGLTAPTSRPSA